MNRTAWFALLVLLAINTMNFFDRQILGAVAGPVSREFKLSDTALGLLGTAFTLLYAVVGVPLGRLADIWPRTRLLAVGVFVWSLLTAVSGLARSFGQLYVVRLGVGVGEATCAPAATSLIADLVPPSARGRAMSLFMMGLPLGIGLSFLVSGTVAQEWGWRAAFFVAGVPGILCAFLVLFVREPQRGATDLRSHAIDEATRTSIDPPVVGATTPSPYFAVLSIPTVWWLIASGAVHNFNMYGIGTFITKLLEQFHGVKTAEAGIIAMIAYGLCGIPGLLIGGWAADAVRKHRVDGRLLVGGVAILLAIPFTYLGLSQPAGATWSLTLWLALGCGSMYVYYAAVYPTLQDVVPAQLRGTAMALYFFAMYLLGASVGPYIFGVASDTFALQYAAQQGIREVAVVDLPIEFRARAIQSTMLLVPAINVILAGVLFAGCLTVRRDVARAAQQVQ